MFSWATFGFGRVTCGVCAVAVPRAQAKQTRARNAAAVCHTCYERWRRSGRVCVRCQIPVKGSKELGVFTDREGLGHADCGGLLLAA